MQAHFGSPVKNIQLTAGSVISRGDFVISKNGLEGSGIYSMSKPLREGHSLYLDLFPDMTLAELEKKLQRPKSKASMSNYLRKTLALDGARLAMLMEFGRPFTLGPELASMLKALKLSFDGFRDMDQAISTAGGVQLNAVDKNLMLKALPSVFCAGEMLDWEAPTGGYLLTACLATGRWAGIAAAKYKTLKNEDQRD